MRSFNESISISVVGEWFSPVGVGKKPGLVWDVLSFSCLSDMKTWYPRPHYALNSRDCGKMTSCQIPHPLKCWQISNSIELPQELETH